MAYRISILRRSVASSDAFGSLWDA